MTSALPLLLTVAAFVAVVLFCRHAWVTGKPAWLARFLFDDDGALSSIIGTSIKVPGVYMKVTLGVGTQSAAAGAKKVILFGNKTSAGTAVVATPYPVTSVDDARTLFGAGSELFLMCKYALNAYPAITLYGICIAASGGTAANDDIVFSGTASADGVYEITVLDETIQVEVDSGATATAIGDLVEAAINAKTDWPVTANNSTGTVTVTAKHAGPRGNQIRILSSGDIAGITETHLNGYLSSGATMDDPQNALDAIASTRYQILVAPYQDATGLADFKTHIANVSGPLEGKRGRYIAGSIDTYANTVTVATGLNDARGQIVWHYNGWQTAAIVAAVAAAETVEAYEADRAANTDGLFLRGLTPQPALADKPTFTELNGCLNNGITPVDHDGTLCEIVRNVTLRSLNDSAAPDFAVIDVHYVEVADAVADDIAGNFLNVFSGFKFDTDVEGEVPDPGVATPSTVKDFIFSRLKFYARGGGGPLWLSNVDALADSLVVEADGVAAGRVNASIPIDPVELLHSGAFDVRSL